nr:MAG TPA: hypothetical protein [Caudoviricetes sp.]
MIKLFFNGFECKTTKNNDKTVNIVFRDEKTDEWFLLENIIILDALKFLG